MIWNFCIRRPVLTSVVFLVVAIFGLIGYTRMPVRESPDVEFPIVSVNVVLPGAEPEVVETEVLEPLEEEINTVEGLKKLTSTARAQVGQVIAEFELWRDIDIATQDVRDRVSRARRELPDGIEAPIVRKLDPDQQAIMWIALSGDARWDAVRLSRYADEVLKPRLESLRGVGRIIVGGERRYAVRVRLDAERLAAHGVTAQGVVRAIRANNVDIPAGRIEGPEREFLVKLEGQFAEAAPLNDLVVATVNGRVVRLADVGEAVDAVENDRQLGRFVGRLAVGLGVVKQSGANTVQVADAARARMRELAAGYPPGLRHRIAADASRYIRESIADLLFTVVLTASLVVLVILAFLRALSLTGIAALAIPTSLLGGVASMSVLGFSINTLTMLALILAVGIVIDDAIVVLESCYRHAEAGTEPAPAARVGTTEVAFAAIANTLSLAAVFIPVAFTQGLVGRLFREFGLTVTVTVFASTLTALTLVPVLASRLLRVPERHGAVYRGLERILGGLEGGYGRVLDAALRRRAVTVATAVAAAGLGYFLFTELPTEFTPTVDRGEFIISFETPEGSTLRETDAYARELEALLADTPEVKHQFLAIGLSRGAGPGKVNEGIAFVRLTPRGERALHQSEVAQELRRRLAEIPAGRAYVIEQPAAAVTAMADVQLVLQHRDLDELARRQAEVMAWMRGQPQFVGVNSDFEMNRPEVEVAILRTKASQMGVSVADIGRTFRLLLGDVEVSEVERRGERFEVITEVASRGAMVPRAILELYVRNVGGALVSLGNLLEAEVAVGPSQINHYQRRRSATVSASLPPGVPLGEAVDALEAHLGASLPEGYDYAFTGRAEELRDSFAYLAEAMVFAIIFIYLVLAAQFESFLHPLIILVALPLALVGAFLALWALAMPFGIVAFIGLIMLLGMATKNAILMVDYANVLVARGRTVPEAAREAATVRFRPVVMTTISTVLGITPIALGLGAGGEARAPMGVAVAAGLLVTTGLTLVVLPTIYVLVDQGADRARSLFRRRGPQAENGTKESEENA